MTKIKEIEQIISEINTIILEREPEKKHYGERVQYMRFALWHGVI
jgi:hypothetical protein